MRASPRAIREILGDEVTHCCNHYLNNQIEQDHRGIKQRYYPMRGFGNFTSASRFCRAFDEIRQFFRFRATMNQSVPLAQQRTLCAPTSRHFEGSDADCLNTEKCWEVVSNLIVGSFLLSSDTSVSAPINTSLLMK